VRSSGDDLVVVILAGGEGARMGGDKPLRPWGRSTLIARACELAAVYTPRMAIAVRDAGQVRGLGDAPLLLDDPRVPGPIAGLISALRHARTACAGTVLTIACDMPMLPPDLARRLSDAVAGGGLCALPESAGRLHPTCGLWRTQAADLAPAYLAAGRSSLRGLAQAVGAVTVDWGDPSPDPFANANTPMDLAALEHRLHAPVGGEGLRSS
jgi:molybdenum cofactor guanylyltransferase